MHIPRFCFAGLLALSAVPLSQIAFGQTDVPERGYNHFRTGANTSETTLNPGNVKSSANQFHKRFVMSADGKIESSPLYAAGVSIAGGSPNDVNAATLHNT